MWRHPLAALWLLAVLLALAGCGDPPSPPAVPPRASDPIIFPDEPSIIGVDLKVDLAGLERDLEAEIPRTLWQIAEEDVTCIPSKKVDLALFKVKTPKLKCDIKGAVKRGKLRIAGRGRDLVLRVPVEAEVSASNIAGILKETGTAAAELRLTLRLDITREWQLRSDVEVDHSWSKEPGIDFLGRRITFTDKADAEMAALRKKVELGLERGLARVRLKAAAERGWQAAHTVVELNRKNPAVWARITPRRFHYGGYNISGRTMRLTFGIEGKLSAHVGGKPKPAVPTRLPPIEPLPVKPGYAVLRVPVVSDYAVLEPVIAKALDKRSRRGFNLGSGRTATARFSEIEVFGTTGNRIAVGITFSATTDTRLWNKARGRVWLSAKPVNAPNSRQVTFADVVVTGQTDMVGEELILAIANSPDLQSTIADALKQNFERDFDKLRTKIDRAIAFRKDGPLAYSVSVERIDTGRIRAYGEGLYLPVAMYVRMDAELVKMD